MDSSLSLLASSSSSPPHSKYHVFPSFHGPDVRRNLLCHILEKFESKGIDAFVDNGMERGKLIGDELKEAIRGSRVAIVLLSKNYASSTWCLSELVEIMESREKLNQTVIPIFYEVDPTDIRKQAKDFGKVFKNTCEGKTEEDIRKWKHALTEVAQISGHHSTNWKTDTEMIEDIATKILKNLNNSAPSSDFDGLVGMESRMRKMETLLRLDSDEVRTIGILGPSGIGKTTTARYIFNQISPGFQLSVFMESIKTIPACSDNYGVKLDLHKQFVSQLINEEGIKIPNLGIAKDRCKYKKVLAVFDDVNQSVQLESMANETWLGPGSRVIITTQDQKILTDGGIKHIHRVELPLQDEALEMFCVYAFGQKSPHDGFKELASEVTRLVGQLPLALRVMGSHFRGMRKEDWTKALPNLKTHIERNGEILSILKFSYDALWDEDKRLFLHIACFFNDEPFDIVEGCLASCFSDVTQGLRILAEKSLIYMEYGSIKMQELLVQLGRKIVREQSVSKPRKRQFLNEVVDVNDVLNDDKPGSSRVLGIHNVYWNSSERVFERFFERFSNLQFLKTWDLPFLKTRDLQFLETRGGGFVSNNMPGKLRFLSWAYFPMSCFPSSFNPQFLVKLEMQYSRLEKLWEGTQLQPLNNLKWMDLNHSEILKQLSDLSTSVNLQEVDLSHCTSLAELPFSIGNAINLQKLDLTCCSSLVEIPSSVTTIINLKSVRLYGCSSLLELPFNIERVTNPTCINLRYCSSLVKLPSSIGNAINLQELDLTGCSSLVELPSSMRNLRRLSVLELVGCSKLEVLLANINLESFIELNLSDCSSLKSNPESSTNIQDLNPSGTTVTEAPSSQLTFKSEMYEIEEHSSMRSWPLPFISKICEMQELGPWIGRISCLRRLVLSGMKNLVSLPQLPYSVVELEADNCESLERLDCSFRNPGIRLNFHNCFKLNQEARDLIIQTPTNQYAVLPGGEVPQCFPYRSPGGSLPVKLNQRTSTKFKACITCADEVEKILNRVSCSITSKESALTCYKNIGRVFPGNLYTFEVETEDVTSTDLVFEFEIHSYLEEWEIKECGIFQILEVPSC